MISADTILTASVVLLTTAEPTTSTPLSPPDQRFAIEVPNVVLTDVPASFIRIEARDASGDLDTSYNKPTLIHGIKLMKNSRDTALPAFRDGC